jgi:formylmethanofuran dehydrogenase subunit B
MTPPTTTSAADRLVRSVTCLGCGCACDDIEVTVRGGRIVDAANACALGVDWFGDGQVPARTRIAGRDVSFDAALDAAARLLTSASQPFVYLAPDISCETQRAGVAMADLLRAALDSVTSATVLDSLLAAQERGRAGATLGQIRNFADVLVFWGVDPSLRYPRYATRYAPEPAGLQVPDGRRSRIVVAVDVGDARGPADADRRVALDIEHEVATIAALSAIVSGAMEVSSTDGLWAPARELAPVILAGHYVVFVADAEPDIDRPARDPGRADALIALTQALNGPTRCALSLLRAGGNRSGADSVATWQTGYPAAVDFSHGYPRYQPHYGTAGARLSRGDIDALLVIGSAGLIPRSLLSLMSGVPCAVIGPRATDSVLGGRDAAIDTGVAGIHDGGTAIRMDDVPLPLRALVTGPPAAETVVHALRDRIAQGRLKALR